MQKGASVVETPVDVLKVLAENNIFKPNRIDKPKQQTLEDYLLGISNPHKNHMEVEWDDPINLPRGLPYL